MLDIKERNKLKDLGYTRVTQIKANGKFGEMDRQLRAKEIATNRTVYGWLEHRKSVESIKWSFAE